MSAEADRKSRVRAVEESLQRIALDDSLNIWSHVAHDEALKAARESDERLRRQTPRSSLEGRLVAIKGNIAVRGWPQEGGLPVRKGIIAEGDAPVIERLRAAGAILLGQTKMDAGALGAEGRSIDGPIRNPHRPSHSVGGSSGGSAAAIAAGHCTLAVGTDTIGSVRIPASYCGIASLKPSHDRISLEGVLPVHLRFDHVGPMSARACELEPMLRIMAEATGTLTLKENEVLPDEADPSRSFAGMTFGYLADATELGVDDTVRAHHGRALDLLRAGGATLQPVHLATLEPGRIRRAVFTLCERQMWLQHRELLERSPELYPEPLRAMLQYGGELTEAKLRDLEARIDRFAASVHELIGALQALVLPTTPTQAFDFSGPTPFDLADLTGIASAAALPAASVPMDTGGELPAGLQIICKQGADLLACRIATRFERLRDARWLS